MIEEQYVSRDTARMLKEAGFRELTKTHYTNIGQVWETALPADYNDDFNCNTCNRPTQALAARWLREVHGMYIEIYHRVTGYGYFIVEIESNELLAIPTIGDKIQFDTYEEAFENALRKAIKLIKK